MVPLGNPAKGEPLEPFTGRVGRGRGRVGRVSVPPLARGGTDTRPPRPRPLPTRPVKESRGRCLWWGVQGGKAPWRGPGRSPGLAVVQPIRASAASSRASRPAAAARRSRFSSTTSSGARRTKSMFCSFCGDLLRLAGGLVALLRQAQPFGGEIDQPRPAAGPLSPRPAPPAPSLSAPRRPAAAPRRPAPAGGSHRTSARRAPASRAQHRAAAPAPACRAARSSRRAPRGPR